MEFFIFVALATILYFFIKVTNSVDRTSKVKKRKSKAPIRKTRFSSWKKPDHIFPEEWKEILKEKVSFYDSLEATDQEHFEFRVHEFLVNCRITGIRCEIDMTDKLLVAASAVIPVFRFPKWRYLNLQDVFILPAMFNKKLETTGPGRNMLGTVGNGRMEGVMIISKPALHRGFENETDGKNTAIHEFIHLIDKLDGTVDGIPSALLQKQYAIPWLKLINYEIAKIYAKKSEINPYGGTSSIEFFAVASEYFFEKPELLAKEHPTLYQVLKDIYRQNPIMRLLKAKKISVKRNDPCPCGSEKRFIICCGRAKY